MEAQKKQVVCEEKSALAFGRDVLSAEAEALTRLAEQLGDEFEQAVRMIHDCQGSIILTGMGKAGIVAQKISG
ncbi:MAG: KpsF/GutQ family sugar-phosphate isomerase, partial [Gammaproteobacteria bacterium]|nr:KpsF/GutQ family sugar-phosphate isomerase [Gammaproteobacteria bacterium]